MSPFAAAAASFGLLTLALIRPSADDVGVGLVLTALGAALAGVLWPRHRPRPVPGYAYALAALGVAAEILSIAQEQDGHYAYLVQAGHLARAVGRLGVLGLVFRPTLVRFAIGVALVAVLSYAWRSMPLARWRLAFVSTAYAYVAVTLFLHAPRPGIDVWQFRQQGCAALLHGRNPYSEAYRVIAPFAPEAMAGGKVRSYCYPPLTLFADVPGHWLGDVRWSTVAATLGAAALIVLGARRLGLPAGHPAELAAAAFLWHPRGLILLELAWTEPFIACAAGLLWWALAGQRKLMARAALGFLLAAKQYAFVATPPLLAGRRLGWRDMLVGIVLALATLVPFAGNPAGLWLGLVTHHVRGPFRGDSLAIPARVAAHTGYHLPGWIALAAAGAVAGVTVRRATPSLARAALATAAILLTLFAFSRQAHLNYYWLCGYFLALAAGLAAVEARASTSQGEPIPPAPGA